MEGFVEGIVRSKTAGEPNVVNRLCGVQKQIAGGFQAVRLQQIAHGATCLFLHEIAQVFFGNANVLGQRRVVEPGIGKMRVDVSQNLGEQLFVVAALAFVERLA